MGKYKALRKDATHCHVMTGEVSWLLGQGLFSLIQWPLSQKIDSGVQQVTESRNEWNGKRNVIEQGTKVLVKGDPSYHHISSIMCKSQHIWIYLGKSVNPYQSARRHNKQDGQKKFCQVVLLVLPITNYPRFLVAQAPEASLSCVT